MHREVSVVITTHARPVAVREALASVLAEEHGDLEVVVVDDGGSFVAPADAGVPIRVVHGSGLGVAGARNAGLAAARGEFVIYLDDDDVALPHRVSCLLLAARQREATLCFGMTRRVVDDGAELLQDVPTHLASGMVGFRDLLACAPHVNAVLVRTEALRAVGGFDAGAEHFDDWAAWLRIADRNPAISFVADTVAEWRIHGNGLSGSVLHRGAMKRRLLALFGHLEGCLSASNARVVAAVVQVVAAANIVTYDDYVHTVAAARERLADTSRRGCR